MRKIKMRKMGMMMKNNDKEKGMMLKPMKNGGGMTKQEVIKDLSFINELWKKTD